MSPPSGVRVTTAAANSARARADARVAPPETGLMMTAIDMRAAGGGLLEGESERRVVGEIGELDHVGRDPDHAESIGHLLAFLDQEQLTGGGHDGRANETVRRLVLRDARQLER